MREGWEYKKLGECVNILDSLRKPVTKKDRNRGIYPYYGASGIQDYVDKYIFDGRYVLVGEDGAKWSAFDKSAFIIEGKTWVNNHAHILQPYDFLIDSYLTFFLNYSDLDYYISGAIVRKLTQTSLRNIYIPIPPKATQLAIVAELDQINDLIRLKKEQLKEYDNLAQSIFYDMFGDPVENEKYPLFELEKVTSNIVDCPHSTPIKSKFPTEYPCIRTSELKGGSIKWETMQYVNQEEYEKRISRLVPMPNDIIYGREGTIGDAVLLPYGYHFCLGQRTMLVRANEQLVIPIYLHRALISNWVLHQAKSKNVASTVAHVNVKDFKKFTIPLPPLPLQQEFSSRIEQIEKLKAEVQKTITDLETLLASRMQYWFE